jgi:MYXO-CTERM domain-containing protein
MCDPATGNCSAFPVKPDGAGCTDNNGCTQKDVCMAGVCSGSLPVICPAPDACHEAGVCNAATGQCDLVPKADGTACNDGNPCTEMDGCQAGTCVGAPKPCGEPDGCHEIAACNPMTGQCDSKPKADGVSCDDGNPCTQTDTCQMGSCKGSNPITCMAKDECHVAGTCDAATGACNDPAAPDGTPCAGGTCQAGTCTPNSTGTGGSGTTTTTTGVGGSGGSSTTTGAGGSGGSSTTTGGDSVAVGGCGCGVASSREGGAAWLALGLLLAVRRRRSRRDLSI